MQHPQLIIDGVDQLSLSIQLNDGPTLDSGSLSLDVTFARLGSHCNALAEYSKAYERMGRMVPHAEASLLTDFLELKLQSCPPSHGPMSRRQRDEAHSNSKANTPATLAEIQEARREATAPEGPTPSGLGPALRSGDVDEG